MSKQEFTGRELDVLLLAAEGKTDKEIAAELGIAVGTVVTYWARMRERLGAANRGQLIAQGIGRIYRETRTEFERLGEIYRVVVESLEEIAIFLMGTDRSNQSWNPGVQRILGFDEEEWMSQCADVIFTDEDKARNAPDEEQRSADQNGKALDERWHKRKDGTRFWASGVMVPVRNTQGRTVCYCKIMRDLSRLKRLEAKVSELGGDPASV